MDPPAEVPPSGLGTVAGDDDFVWNQNAGQLVAAYSREDKGRVWVGEGTYVDDAGTQTKSVHATALAGVVRVEVLGAKDQSG